MKTLKTVFILLSLLTLSSCDLLNIFLFEEEEQESSGTLRVLSRENLDIYNSYTTQDISDNICESNGEGDLFFIKYNNTNYDIKGTTTGYVTNTSKELQPETIQSNITVKTPKFNRVDFRYSNDFIKQNDKASRSADIINENIYQNYSVGESKTFYIIPKLDNQQTVESVSAKLKYESEYAYIWYVTNQNYISPSSLVTFKDDDFEKIGIMFDKIFPIETNVFGAIEYNSKSNFIPANEKVSILIYDINSDAHSNQNSGTFGYFYPLDLYKNDYTNYSNESHIFYIDDYFTKNAPKYIYSTLAHEFQHMLNFINKKIKNSTSQDIQTWYTEMLSLVCEEMLQDTIKINDEESPKYRLNIFNVYYNKGFTNWREGNEVYISYANAYAFGAFLLRNFGGSNIIKEITNNSSVNQESITSALRKLGYNEDFNSVCEKFAQTVIFTQDCNKNDFYSLNRKIEEQDFTFDAIDLTDKFYANEISNLPYYGPVIYSPLQTDGLSDIGANAFSVHYIGKNIKTTSYSLPTTSNIRLTSFECK